MWIAKPIEALSADEKRAWVRVQKSLESRAIDVPLAQTLTWAQAVQAVSGRAYAVFNSNESAGGIVFATSDPLSGGLRFECVNGPLLDWDDPERSPRQLATFAMGVSKLDRGFRSLTLRPRWLEGQLASRCAHLPVQLSASSRAATIQLDVGSSPADHLRALSPRLRRTISVTEAVYPQVLWKKADRPALAEFVPALTEFGRAKGFTVPGLPWFEALASQDFGGEREGASLWIGSVEVLPSAEASARAEVLVAWVRQRAYYLFGHERRTGQVRSALSPSALAHWTALQKAGTAGLSIYDLNGYVENPPPGHAYAGVSHFKSQFGGRVIRYEVPEFRIE